MKTEFKKITISKKQWKKIHIYIRTGIQLLYFFLLPSAFTATFNGAKYIFTQLGAGEAIEKTAFLMALVGLCAFTILFGRFFCGFACAFGSFGDLLRFLYVWVCKKLKKKPFNLKEEWMSKLIWIKYLILAVIAVLCFAGLYDKTRGYSPWDVFSMIHAGNFKLGSYVLGVILLLLIMAGMCVQERFFCRALCPMGAIFSLLPTLPQTALRRERENCIARCSACTRRCPSALELPADGCLDTSGECFQCQKCIDTCPKGNIHCGAKALKGNEPVYTLIRALLLAALLIWCGI